MDTCEKRRSCFVDAEILLVQVWNFVLSQTVGDQKILKHRPGAKKAEPGPSRRQESGEPGTSHSISLMISLMISFFDLLPTIVTSSTLIGSVCRRDSINIYLTLLNVASLVGC